MRNHLRALFIFLFILILVIFVLLSYRSLVLYELISVLYELIHRSNNNKSNKSAEK